jgi:hypothetical protein
MLTFKPGDKLLCISTSEFTGGPVEGNTYTCKEYLGSELRVDELKDSWFSNRFVLATPLLKALS